MTNPRVDAYSNPQVDAHGTERWYDEDGKLHRVDGPAVRAPIGNNYWYQHGKLHRLDGPAVVSSGGGLWYINNQLYDSLDKFCRAAGITGKHKTLFMLQYSDKDFH